METAQLQALWDHLQIGKVLATYCRAIDRCDKELLKSVYWPDASEDHGIFNGNAWDFAEFIIPLLKGMRGSMHKISNTLIDLHGERASAETYVCAYHLVDEEDGRQTDLVVGGRYLDRFERREGQWRISNRIFVLDWNQNQPATSIWDSGMHAQMRNRGSHDRNDLSYGLFDRNHSSVAGSGTPSQGSRRL